MVITSDFSNKTYNYKKKKKKIIIHIMAKYQNVTVVRAVFKKKNKIPEFAM